jgi:hypothetical protein
VAIAALPPAIVAARSSRIVGQLVGPSTNGGANFFMAQVEVKVLTFPEEKPNGISPLLNAAHYEGTFASPRPFYDEAYFYREGMRAIARSPRRALGRAAERVKEGLAFGHLPLYPRWLAHDDLLTNSIAMATVFGLAPALFTIGAALRQRRDVLVHASLAVLVLSLLGALVLYVGEPRIRVPYDPLFFGVAAAGYGRLGERLVRRSALGSSPPSAPG